MMSLPNLSRLFAHPPKANMKSILQIACATLVVTCCGLIDLPVQAADAPAAAGVEFFEKKIRPVLLKHCYECHSSSSKKVKGGLLLDTQAATLKGGDTGPAIVPKKVDESLLIDALRHNGIEMPPKGKLPDAVIADFVKWVEMGAPDPRQGEGSAKKKIDFEKAREYWAFQPVRKPSRPTVKKTDWPTSSVDYFTLAKMEEHNLSPVDPATKRELIRRATFDLIGLPPTPADVNAFVADKSPAAFEKVVDRLLKSKHYGERWGRYWLDVARYSEDQAHTFSVRKNSNGYRYRDWVVAAFNSDMPYDKFVKLQIAGDLIGPDESGSHDHLVALGLFGLGAQYYKNSDKAKAAADELDDRIDTLTRGFLGLTVSCARCHDHKFDPIPTQDYYSLAGIFQSSRLHNAPLCNDDDVKAYNEGQQKIKQTDAKAKEFLASVKTTAAESKVDQIFKFMETVWIHNAIIANGKRSNTKELAKNAGLNEFLLKRWVTFLDPKQKGKVKALDEWFALSPATKSSDASVVPKPVAEVAKRFQGEIQQLLNIRDGVSTSNLVKLGAGKTRKSGAPVFLTPIVTKLRPVAGIDVDIKSAKQLYLVVNDGGNGKSCDHADWIAPRLVGPKGELKLTDMKWKSADGFQGVRVVKNNEGKPIRVGGKRYPNGLGTHAPSVIAYDIPAGYERFKAIGGLDNSGSDQNACGEQASIQFAVYFEKPINTKTSKGKDLLTQVLGKDGPLTVRDNELEEFLSGEKGDQLKQFREAHEAAKRDAPPMYPIAHSYREGNAADMRVFARGNPARQKELAPRRFLRVIAGEDRPHYTKGSGRRELAEAIANADNPLTPRVMANRIWQHHFGRGIVATPSNFGKLGEAPTHPELLNYLAAIFLESGWSIKTLHREIMLSSTYQLSSSHNAANADVDADNRFLWKMYRRRLDVEAWRDSLLDVSGRLDRSLAGPSTNLADAGNVRRTVYAKISRHELDSLLRLFDFPDANITSSKRSETTVPQQQLFVLNSPFMVEQAKSFSGRLHKEARNTDSDRIKLAFLLAYGRPAREVEVELGLAYLSGEKDKGDKLSLWESYAQVLLGANEFMYLD
jgi:hypothetical protein